MICGPSNYFIVRTKYLRIVACLGECLFSRHFSIGPLIRRRPDDIRRFQLHLAEAGVSIRNRIMTGLRFLFRVTLRPKYSETKRG